MPQAEAHWEYGQWQYEWQDNGMLKSVRKPDGTYVRFEYNALGRRTAKVLNGQIQRVVYDGNVLLHQWEYEEKDRPKTVTDEVGMLKIDKEEPVENLVTWVFEEGTFV
ncbi:MAG: RHS repeat domain-containing protein, partial [Bacteroidota bacterium]